MASSDLFGLLRQLLQEDGSGAAAPLLGAPPPWGAPRPAPLTLPPSPGGAWNPAWGSWTVPAAGWTEMPVPPPPAPVGQQPMAFQPQAALDPSQVSFSNPRDALRYNYHAMVAPYMLPVDWYTALDRFQYPDHSEAGRQETADTMRRWYRETRLPWGY